MQSHIRFLVLDMKKVAVYISNTHGTDESSRPVTYSGPVFLQHKCLPELLHLFTSVSKFLHSLGLNLGFTLER